MRRFSVPIIVLTVTALSFVACSLFSYTIPYKKINKQTESNTVQIAKFPVGKVNMKSLRFSHGVENRMKVEAKLIMKQKTAQKDVQNRSQRNLYPLYELAGCQLQGLQGLER